MQPGQGKIKLQRPIFVLTSACSLSGSSITAEENQVREGGGDEGGGGGGGDVLPGGQKVDALLGHHH